MSEQYRSPFNGGQVQLAKRYREVLEAIYTDLQEPFKARTVTARFEDVGHGDLLKLKHSGLLRNETARGDEPKDWFLTRKTKRWLRNH